MIRSKIKRINPEKSNKMILAVAGGVALIVLAFFTLIIVGGSRGGSRSMSKILAYLKNTEGLVEIQARDAEKRALIVFNSDSKNAGNFEKIAFYAALRLSRHWPDCQVFLARNAAEQVVYRVRVRDGAVVEEGPVQTPGPSPSP
ncbi:MAG: hypothetical protein JXO51_10075 [Candidatus Aminicenantes bacterium]|nr:hypothetical protein [Candidatus Aminicenantes bacterium]